MAYCEECGAQVAYGVRLCPKCYTKYCSRNNDGQSLTIGERNVVAGDVIGHKEAFHISGNATIVKHDDETKKMVRCHVCGCNIPIVGSFECPNCHDITCSACYDKSKGICVKCAASIEHQKEAEYKALLAKVYEDGKVELSERKELNALKEALGITCERAEAMEKSFRTANKSIASLSAVERGFLREAERCLFDKCKPTDAIAILEPIHALHPLNEEVMAVYLPALAAVDRGAYDKFLAGLQVDSISAELSRIDLLMRETDLMLADNRINKALDLWPDCLQFKFRRIVCDLMAHNQLGKECFLKAAIDEFDKLKTTNDVLANSWYDYIAAILTPYIQDVEQKRKYTTPIYKAITEGTYIGFSPVISKNNVESSVNEEEGQIAEELRRKGKENAAPANKLFHELLDGMLPIDGQGNMLSKTQVTQAIWMLVMGTNPSHFHGANKPVEMVSRSDCLMFIEQLNSCDEIVASGLKFCLPHSDLMAEIIKSGGRKIRKGHYGDFAWTWENSHRETHVVAERQADAFGLFDLRGNVWEWCEDGVRRGNENVYACVGGAWCSEKYCCERIEYFPPKTKASFIGLRLAACGRER